MTAQVLLTSGLLVLASEIPGREMGWLGPPEPSAQPQLTPAKSRLASRPPQIDVHPIDHELVKPACPPSLCHAFNQPLRQPSKPLRQPSKPLRQPSKPLHHGLAGS